MEDQKPTVIVQEPLETQDVVKRRFYRIPEGTIVGVSIGLTFPTRTANPRDHSANFKDFGCRQTTSELGFPRSVNTQEINSQPPILTLVLKRSEFITMALDSLGMHYVWNIQEGTITTLDYNTVIEIRLSIPLTELPKT